MTSTELAKKLKTQRYEVKHAAEWYSLRSILGYSNKALIYVLLGAREAGKSYAVLDLFLRQFKHKGTPFYWIRLSREEAKKLLQNNGDKLIDPALRRKYKLDLHVNGGRVYAVKRDKTTNKIKSKTLMCTVIAASDFAANKGQGYYDQDFLKNNPGKFYNIAVDEFQRERGSRNTFDVMYSLVNTFENLIRSTKERLRIIFIGNLLEEASDVLTALNFVPEKYGRYYLPSKKCVIDYIAPSDKYLERRVGTIADLLSPEESTFTNEIKLDKSLVVRNKFKVGRPAAIIKFKKDTKHWFVVTDKNIILPYTGQSISTSINMRPYLDGQFNSNLRDGIINMFDSQSLLYKNFITFRKFENEIKAVKPRNSV